MAPVARMGVKLAGVGPPVALVALSAVWLAAGVAVAADPSSGPTWTAPAGARETEEGWFAPVQRSHALPALPATVTHVFVIPIDGAITDTLADALERKVLRCKASGAELVIFRLNTPGGSGEAMDRIVQLILDELGSIRTVAFVAPKALSAGAIISLACNEIVMTPTAVIGDAMPIMIGPEGLVEIPPKERGKFESAARGQVRVLAGRNGYNLDLCEAMVTITHELWLIRHAGTGELRIVEATEWRHRVAGAPPSTAPAGGKPPTDGSWEYLRTLDGPEELVTLTAEEATFDGLAAEVAASLVALGERYDLPGPPTILEDTWSERLVTFLTSPAVVAVLFFAGLLCVYVEMHTPGFGVAGTTAILCFAILFGSRYLVGMAAWWEIALFALGLALLGVEVFVTPGFGVAGIAGILCCAVALLAMFVPNAPLSLPIPTTKLDWRVLGRGVLALSVAFIAAVVAMPLLARVLPKVPVASRLVLAPPAAAAAPPVSDSSPSRTIQVGQRGVVTATCRPAGVARFNETLVDVVAEGAFIYPGTAVVVLKNEGNRIVVAPAP
ncbi:MAG: hypothetical protein MUP47_01905 [Phycisphaerae bacterium]|nr:hypothetical protein [Phycisphaerae bacterium]